MKAFGKGHTLSITTTGITDLKILRSLLFSVVEAQNDMLRIISSDEETEGQRSKGKVTLLARLRALVSLPAGPELVP